MNWHAIGGDGRSSHIGHSHAGYFRAGLNNESSLSATVRLVSDSLTVTTGRGSVRRSVSTQSSGPQSMSELTTNESAESSTS